MRCIRRILSGSGAPLCILIVLAALGLISPPACRAFAALAETAQLRSPDLRSINSIAGAGHNLLEVRGAVTLLAPSFIVIQDESGAVEVKPAAGSDSVSIGDEVDVTGRLAAGAHTMLEGTVQRLWSGSAPLAGVLTPDFAADGQNELSLVNLTGQIVSSRFTGSGGLELTMQGEHQFFTAYLPQASRSSETWPSEDALRRALRKEATLQLTGVLDAVPPAHGVQGSFTLALRSPDDIVLLKAPPWWTPEHITAMFLALALLAAATVALHIRNLRLRYRAVTEERLRIARDIHDTMAQGFAGIALQLQAAEHTLPATAEYTRRHLQLALGMVRHSRGESHRSIQMLRSLATERSLATMLEQAARQAAEGSPVRIEVTVLGHEPKLPYDTAMQLYRIGQEAIANAVQHASAHSIHLALDFRRNEIAMCVTDDGCGFDPARIESNGKHFGLAGIGERVDGLRGRLDVESNPGGSKLFVAIPWPA